MPPPAPETIEEAEARAGEVYDRIREASADAIRSGDADELAALREHLEARRDELCERAEAPARLCRENRD